jgi:hypothetical protein
MTNDPDSDPDPVIIISIIVSDLQDVLLFEGTFTSFFKEVTKQ